MSKVCIINSGAAYARLFENYGFEIVKLEEAELVCFTGGEDVSPYLYGDDVHHATFCNPDRDEAELEIFNHCVQHGIPMVGICRGAQFLNVASGGRMYQHVSNHAISGTHVIVDIESGETIDVTSTHHQMMMPHVEANVIAIANRQGFREWYDGEVACRDQSNTDYEVVYYSSTRSLCFQPHPEMYQGDKDCNGMRNYFFRLINQYLEV